MTAAPELIDTHCHLDMDDYRTDLDEVVAMAYASAVVHIITIGIDYKSSMNAVELARRFPNVSATIGVHPHSAGETSRQGYERLALLADTPENKVVGFGEIGLDYAKNYSDRQDQLREFTYQLGLARELNIPLVIHDREAHDDILRLLRQCGPFPAGGVMHCFSGDSKMADQILEMGFYLSIPGIVTFKNAVQLQQIAREIPIERLLLETDGPFLAPTPYRGKRNLPQYLRHTAEKVAQLRQTSLTDLAGRTTQNARRLFSLGETE